MTYDPTCWMGPEDGSLQDWLDDRRRPLGYATYIVGIDPGQRLDHTSVSVLSQQYNAQGFAFYEVGWLKRWPLGTRYTSIAGQVKRLDTKLRLRAVNEGKEASLTYIVDALGPGTAAVELLERELNDARVFKCFLTSGLHANVDYREREISLPKWEMVATLASLLDSGQISFPKNARYIDAMVEELQAYESHRTDSGAETFAARTGKHDDMVCSVAMAAWWGRHESVDPNKPTIW